MNLAIKVFLYTLPFQIFFFNWHNFSFSLSRILLIVVSLPLITKIKKLLKTKALIVWALFLITTAISFLVAEKPEWTLRKWFFLINLSAALPIFYFYVKNTASNLFKILKLSLEASALPLIFSLLQFTSQFFFSKENLFSFFKLIGSFFWGKELAKTVINIPSWYVKINSKDIMRTFFPFPDPHSLALYVNLIFALLFISFFIYQALNKKLFYFLLALSSTVQLLTFSRGGYLIFFIELLMIFFLIKESRKITFFLLFILLTSLFLLPIFSERFLSIVNFSDFSISERFNLWNKAIKLILNHPLEGIGLGNFPFYVNRFLKYYNPINLHNSYLEIAAETGIFALIFFVLFNALIIYQAAKKQHLPLIIPLTGFLIHGFFESNIYNVPNFSLFLIICAIILTTEKKL